MVRAPQPSVAAEELSVLASEHRIRILQTLAGAESPLGFSDLRESVGMYDSGRFNYHLTELCGLFVRETNEGYELSHAGERVVLAAADLDPAGASALAEQATENGTECPVCG